MSKPQDFIQFDFVRCSGEIFWDEGEGMFTGVINETIACDGGRKTAFYSYETWKKMKDRMRIELKDFDHKFANEVDAMCIEAEKNNKHLQKLIAYTDRKRKELDERNRGIRK